MQQAARLALALVQVKIEKVQMHRASFEKAVRIENQALHQVAMQVSYERIKVWSGVGCDLDNKVDQLFN